jgi:hypothetical protein
MNIKSISLFRPKPEPYTGEEVTKQELVFAWFPKILTHYRTKKKVFVWLRYVYVEYNLKSIIYYYQKDRGNGLFFSLSDNSKRLNKVLNKDYFLSGIEKYAPNNIFLSYRWLNSKWYEDLFEKIKSLLSPTLS